jgi:hypothetical protein
MQNQMIHRMMISEKLCERKDRGMTEDNVLQK